MTAPQSTAPVLLVAALFTERQRVTLAQALADGIEYRYPGACADCDDSATGLCEPHADDLSRADAYAALGRELGLEIEL